MGYIEVKTYKYKILLHMLDGTIDTVEKESWLSPNQIEDECRMEYDRNPEDVLLSKMTITWEEN